MSEEDMQITLFFKMNYLTTQILLAYHLVYFNENLNSKTMRNILFR